MKKKISILLIICILISFVVPLSSYAATDLGLEKAILKAKSLLNIPTNYVLTNYNPSTNGKIKNWSFNWQSKDKSITIYATISETGNLMSYSKSENNTESSIKKFSKITRAQADVAAKAFIKKVFPSALNKLVALEAQSPITVMDSYINLNYARKENNIPYYSNNMSVSINKLTGEIASYYANWSEDLKFPTVAKPISVDKAKDAFIKKLGLKLIYASNYDGNTAKPFAVYTQVYNYGYYIDAATGSVITSNNGVYGMGSELKDMKSKSTMMNEAAAKPSLTPEEKAAILKVSKLISEADAEKIARKFEPAAIDSSYKLSSITLDRAWNQSNEFIYSMNFLSKASEDHENDMNIYVSVNAVNGTIINFSVPYEYQKEDTAQYDKNQSLEIAKSFLSKYYPSYAKNVKLSQDNSYVIYRSASEELPLSQYFTFVRVVNGAEYPNDAISINIDTVNGKVSSFSLGWSNVSFPSLSKALSKAKINDIFLKNPGLELSYVPVYYTQQEIEQKKIVPYPSSPKAVKLVYSVKLNAENYYDAFTGKAVDYSGKPIVKSKIASFNDIKKNAYENQIKALAEWGILSPASNSKFNPEYSINQADFTTMLYKCLYYDSSNVSLDQVTKTLLAAGIIKKPELKATANVTKGDALKFVIRAMKLEKVANLTGIYINKVADAASIPTTLKGYAAIGQGYGLIKPDSKGNLNLSKPMTRSEAVNFLYNYLKQS